MIFAEKRKLATIIAVLFLLTVPLLPLSKQSLSAAKLENRTLELGTSIPSANTTHAFSFDITTSQNVGSIEFEYCSNSPLFTESCEAMNGLDASGAQLINQTGETGFSIHGSSTANSIVLSRSASATTAGTSSYEFSEVINPNTANESFFVRISTYASDDATGTPVDEGALAATTTQAINVNAYVPPYLEFCVGVVIFNNDCATASGSYIDFGILTPNQTRSGISKMQAATNAAGGYMIQVEGTTMTSGNNVIQALEAPTSSQPGVDQFGMNMRANSDPSVGLEPSGPGTAQPTANYNTPNQFMFNNGDAIIYSSIPNDRVTFTASYVVNIEPEKEIGNYTTTLTYICTGSF